MPKINILVALILAVLLLVMLTAKATMAMVMMSRMGVRTKSSFLVRRKERTKRIRSSSIGCSTIRESSRMEMSMLLSSNQSSYYDHWRGPSRHLSSFKQQQRSKYSTTTIITSSATRNSNNYYDDEIETDTNTDTDMDVDNTNNVMMSGWTVRKAMDESIRRLEDKKVTEPEYSVLHLMAFALQLPWENGIRDLITTSTDDDTKNNSSNGNNINDDDNMETLLLTYEQAKDFERMLQRREQHEPIQYVLGQWDFLDYIIAIRRPLLCPRPETEELVMKIVEEATESPVRILDCGCGTGVIGIALAEILPDATVEAIDIEPIAIETSMENAQRVLKDQSGGIDKYPDCYTTTLISANDYKPEHPFDIVVSNPPYIPRNDMKTLTDDVTKYESDEALCGGNDGMDVIRTIIRKLPEWCNSEAVCWMEVDPSHPKIIQEWLDNQDGGKVRFESSHKDMFGKDRFVKLRVL